MSIESTNLIITEAFKTLELWKFYRDCVTKVLNDITGDNTHDNLIGNYDPYKLDPYGMILVKISTAQYEPVAYGLALESANKSSIILKFAMPVILLYNVSNLTNIIFSYAKNMAFYGLSSIADKIRKEISASEVLYNENYLLICKSVDVDIGKTEIDPKYTFTLNNREYIADIGDSGYGTIVTIDIDIINKELFLPPLDNNVNGGLEYKKAKENFNLKRQNYNKE